MKEILDHLQYFKKIIQISNFSELNKLFKITKINSDILLNIDCFKLPEEVDSLLIDPDNNEFNDFIGKYLKSEKVVKKLAEIKITNTDIDYLISQKDSNIVIKEILEPKILIIPYYFKNEKEKFYKITPFGLPFKIDISDYKNQITITPVGIPVFSKNNILLDKNDTMNDAIFTELEEYLSVLDSNYFEGEVSNEDILLKWNKWISYIKNLVAVFENDINYQKINEVSFIHYEESNDYISVKMQDVINCIDINDKKPEKFNLFKKYIKGLDTSYSNNDMNVLTNDMFKESKSSFTGQLKVNKNYNGYFSLNNNQRIFIRALNDKKSDIIALNGPPGTGKTTVLQSAIATLIVKSITEGDCKMPIFFGLAATNQAKNNIIDGFKIINILKDMGNEGILSKRWLNFDSIDDLDYGVQLNPKNGDIGLEDLSNNMKKVFSSENDIVFMSFFKELNINSITNEFKRYYKITNKNLNIKITNKDIEECEDIESAQEIIKSLILSINKYLNDVECRKNEIFINYKEINNILKEIKIISEKVLFIKKELTEIEELAEIENNYKNKFLNEINEIKLKIDNIESKENKDILTLKNVYKEWNKYYDSVNIVSKIFNKKKNLIFYYEILNSAEFYNVKIIKNFNKVKDIDDFFLDISKNSLKSTNIKNNLEEDKLNLIKQQDIILKDNLIIEEKLKKLTLVKEELFKKIEDLESTILKDKEKILKIKLDFNYLIDTLEEQDTDKIIKDFEISKNYEKLYANISAVSDNLFKPLLFNLSMKYYEAKFIIDYSSIKIENKVLNKDGNSFKSFYAAKKYELFSNIYPVFVSTMHSLIKNMVTYNIKDKKDDYLFNFIDYAVIDESGQCNPEIGSLAFLFSKKAIVVGDTDQIEPIYGVKLKIDNLIYNDIMKKNINIADFSNLPFNCSSGNVMKIAQNNSLYNPYHMFLSKGLYLLEHRRCPKEIISYCNELVYGNKLEYSEGSDFESFTKSKLYLDNQKPWNFIDVKGEFVSNTNSKHNKEEAVKIAEWLEFNYDKIIKDSDKKKIENIVAVLTPYAGQERIIKSELKKINNPNIPKDAFANLVVGTAHKLQGAERDIILFSSTWRYSDKSKTSFIDNSKSIINVVISRAKQSIYVFGDSESFEKSTGDSTKLMWKYLKES